MPTLTVDDIRVEVPEGTSILNAAKKAGVKIPSLCYMKDVQAIGACRVCLVEVEGARTLVASCVMPVNEGMKVYTQRKRVRDARKMVVELLLSDHEGDCQTCARNDDCELQALAGELGIRDIRFPGEKSKSIIDDSTPALVRDSGKCVLCRRCVTVCRDIQGVGGLFAQNRGFDTVVGPAFCGDLDDVVCVQCGQCGAVCPVGAISENDQIAEVWAALEDPTKTVVVQTAPAIRAALGECFGNPPGTLVTGKMVSALRRLGFDGVFDTNFAADLCIIEEGTELLLRLKKALVDKQPVALPMFTSCSPGWIKFLEYFYPDMLPHLSTCKSPQQMFGALAKTYYAEKIGKKPEDMFVVSIMPCTAKKFECQRPEMNDSGVRDVDVVLTTRELARIIRLRGLELEAFEPEPNDTPFGERSTAGKIFGAPMTEGSGAADIFANTGGVMEAALRTVYEIVVGKPFPFENLHVTPIAGLEGIKEAAVTFTETVPAWSFLKGVTAKVAVTHGLGNIRQLLDRIKSGEATYHFIEVMTCPGGCIGGGGQPRMTDNSVRLARIAAIYKEDEGKKLRKSHENPD
ncbi:MAG: 2Fe-2S iron-sulfur cluster-binding protein, partial [Candidatus Hydrogenedentes bacterium]|nr:2Fe-2S iron-sulfur cluster-binding protein [Candidatus Hydrogenedentota bacterium]